MATQLASKNVVGRDGLIVQIWRILRRDSVVFTAERRIGKTTVMDKMKVEAPEGVIATYLDLEKVDTSQRFVEVLLSEVKGLLPGTEVAKAAFKGLFQSLGGTEIGGIIKLPKINKDQWQAALEKTLACICEHHRDSMILFLFDELPYMLQKIAIRDKKEGSSANNALAILDSLRAIRKEQSNLRMIYSGSIGLHHVVHALRGTDYPSQPTNDMEVVPLGPIARPDAMAHAKRLFEEDDVNCDGLEDVINEVVTQTDCVPFYIERVVKRLALAEEGITSDMVKNLILSCLTDDNDIWEMEHFRTRIPIYYPGELATGDHLTIPLANVAKTILDIMATTEVPLNIDQIYGAVKASLPVEDRSLVVQMLKNLSQDHYLICDSTKYYSFRFPLIKQWWKLAQGL
jgi:hypothetical protein